MSNAQENGRHTAWLERLDDAAELRQLFSSSPVALVLVDPDSLEFLAFNRRAHEQLGYSSEEFARLDVPDLVPHLSPEELRVRCRELMEGMSAGLRTLQRASDGSIHHVLVCGEGLTIEGRHLLYASMQDVTSLREDDDRRRGDILERRIDARTRALAALVDERSAELEALLDNAPLGFAFFDAECRYLRVNQHLAAINGLPVDAHIGARVADLFPGESRVVEPTIRQVFRTGRPITGLEITAPPLHTDGEPRVWLTSFYPVRNDDGGIVSVGSFVLDISERKRMEQALRESEERFRETFDNLPVGIAHVDGEGRCIRGNRHLSEITGFPPDELRGRSFTELSHPEDLPKELDQFEQLMRGEIDSYRIEQRFFRADGELRWASITAALQRSHWGEPLYCISAIVDITDRRRAEEALVDADRARTEFLAMLGHELRNPLSPITNALLLLQETEIDDEERSWLLAMIDRQVGQLVRLTDDLLEVSRVTRGKIELRRQVVELTPLVEHALQAISPTILERHHTLHLARPEEEIVVAVDPGRIEQVIANLLNNAAKYTEPGGEIWVAIRREGEEAVISVRDDGIGIDAETLPRIFEPFTQARRSLDQSRGGLGVGLALVRSLVELHGGSVAVTSEGPGQGSTFTIRLPISLATGGETDAVPDDTREDAGASPQRTILVVDDNPDAASSLALRLRRQGHRTIEAHDGATALDLALLERPEIILLDIGLPGMDGYEVARRLRNAPTPTELTIVAVTGHGQDEDRRQAIAAGFDHHIVKPIDWGALDRILREAPLRPH